MFETKVPTETYYRVDAMISPGDPTTVYRGTDFDEAVRVSNFWDERVDTFLRAERPPLTPTEKADYRFDQLLEMIGSYN